MGGKFKYAIVNLAAKRAFDSPCQSAYSPCTHSFNSMMSPSHRQNKLALDEETASEEAASKDDIPESNGDSGSFSHAPKLGEIPHASPIMNLAIQSQDKEGTPVILSLIRETPNLMSSSMILSSIHAKTKQMDGGQRGSQDGCSSIMADSSRPQIMRRSKTVDKVLTFHLSGSNLVKSEKIRSAATGTCHTAFVTGTHIELFA